MSMLEDRELLGRYASLRDAEAFSEIVRLYQKLVYATCRRRLNSTADVDDAVQETFLRLARKAGEIRSNIGAWLHQCAMNVAIDMNRRRSTRAAYESAAVGPLDRDQRELAELREHVDAALAKLQEEQRELLIQRYFVGRSQVEMAASRGIAPSTLSERLAKAVDALREQLAAMGCVALTASAMVVSSLQAETASVTVPVTLTSNLVRIGLSGTPAATVAAGAGIALGLKIAIAAIIAMVAGIGIWLVTAANGPATAGNPAPPPPAGQAVAVSETPQADRPTAVDWQQRQGISETAVLAGRVVDDSGKPVAGIRVQLVGPSNEAVRTDEAGNYAFEAVAGTGEYRVMVWGERFVEVGYDAMPRVQLTRGSRARRDVTVQRGVQMVVSVLDADGKPIPAARVEVARRDAQMGGGRRAMSDQQGYATSAVAVSPTPYIVSAVKEGFAPVHSLVDAKSIDETVDVELVMQRGRTIRGVAICSDGKPATGYQIYAQPEWWNSYSLSKLSDIDKDGNFVLTDVGSGNHQLWFHSNDTSRALKLVDLSSGELLKVTLPVASLQSTHDLVGRFTIAGKAPGHIEITAIGKTVRDRHDGRATVGITLDGKPLKPNEGEFRLTGLPAGQYELRLEAPEIEPKRVTITVPGELPTIELIAYGKPILAGRVVDAETNQPIGQFALRVRKVEQIGNGPGYVQDRKWVQVSNPAGAFEVPLVGPGVYEAQVSASGYAWTFSPQLRIEKGRAETEVRLDKGGELAGRVLDADGMPVLGAKVIPFSRAQAFVISDRPRIEGEAGAVLTDADGRFGIPLLAAGDERLKIVHPRYAPIEVGGLKVAPGAATTAPDVVLRVGGTIEGYVYDGLGRPAAGAALHFQDAVGYGGGDELAGRLASAVTDENGVYRVEHLPEQAVYISQPDRWQKLGVVQRIVRPRDGATVRADFGGSEPLRGRAIVSGQPVADTVLMLSTGSSYSGSLVARTQSDSQGNFTFYGIPAGRYLLHYMKDGRSQQLGALRTGGASSDIGDITSEESVVVVEVEADSLENVQVVIRGAIAEREGSSAIWRAKGLPGGKHEVTAMVIDGDRLKYLAFASFEHTVSVDPTRVRLRVPRADAKASLRVQTDDPKMVVTLQNEEAQARFTVRDGEDQLEVPAGTYRALFGGRPIPDVAPIMLRQGETIDVALRVSRPDTCLVAPKVWSADGSLLDTAELRVTSSTGEHIAPPDGQTTSYTLAPGDYKVAAFHDGKPVGQTSFTIAKGDRQKNIEIAAQAR